MTTPTEPTPTQTQASGNVLSIIAMVCGVIALIFIPILFGIIGVVLGIIAKTRHERLSTWGIVVPIVGAVIGIIIGVTVMANS